MKIAEENGESFDCRLLIDDLTMQKPEYLKGRAAREAAAELPAGDHAAVDDVKPAR
jgi:hypothetical protein